MIRKRNEKGQSTLEYVIVLTAIVGAIIWAAMNFIKPSMNKIYGDVNTSMDNAGGVFAGHAGVGCITTRQ